MMSQPSFFSLIWVHGDSWVEGRSGGNHCQCSAHSSSGDYIKEKRKINRLFFFLTN